MKSLETEKLALLTIGQIKLAMPQNEIRSVEVRADIQKNDTGYSNIAGKLIRNDGVWPVISLADNFELKNELNDELRFFACIRKDELFYALACDSLELIENRKDIVMQSLPVSMRTDRSAISYLMKIDGELVFYVDGQSMNRYLNSLGVLDVEK